MQILTPPFSTDIPPLVASIGFFDGVHRGHRFLIGELIAEAKREGLSSAVITFRNHPRKLIDPSFSPELLSSFDEKMTLLEQTGVDYCIVLDFTPQIRDLSASRFIQEILSEQLHTKTLITGYDHRFGKNREEGFEDYCRYGKACGMQVLRETGYAPDGLHVSSSEVRRKLLSGHLSTANELLGRSYNLEGVVEEGFRIGRKIGFPTANIRPCEPDKLIPKQGVYAVYVEIDGIARPGMLNIGIRPTVHDSGNISIEAHLFGFDGDLYGKTVNIRFIEFLREERKMESLGELQRQLEKDKIAAQSVLSLHEAVSTK
ncbi:MAG: bifunctional riboflavin kinase/FAD synthetase [Bacteroidales bacterium]